MGHGDLTLTSASHLKSSKSEECRRGDAETHSSGASPFERSLVVKARRQGFEHPLRIGIGAMRGEIEDRRSEKRGRKVRKGFRGREVDPLGSRQKRILGQMC
jgi:hypothetical protein